MTTRQAESEEEAASGRLHQAYANHPTRRIRRIHALTDLIHWRFQIDDAPRHVSLIDRRFGVLLSEGHVYYRLPRRHWFACLT